MSLTWFLVNSIKQNSSRSLAPVALQLLEWWLSQLNDPSKNVVQDDEILYVDVLQMCLGI